MVSSSCPSVVVRLAPTSSGLSGLRVRLRGLLGLPLVVRHASGWVEVVVFGGGSVERVRGVLEAAGFRVVEAYCARHEWPLRGAVERYAAFLRGEHFWEAHSVGEAVWRGVGEEGRLLAVIAGALAKAQEGEAGPAYGLLEKARRLASRLGVGGLVDWACLNSCVARVLLGFRANPVPCMERLLRHLALLVEQGGR